MIIEEIDIHARRPHWDFAGVSVEVSAVCENTIYLAKPIKPGWRFTGCPEALGYLSCSTGPAYKVRWFKSAPDVLYADGLTQDFRNGDEEAAEFPKALSAATKESI